MTTETKRSEAQQRGHEPRISDGHGVYESGYDLPTYLRAPLCPVCGELYCYCPERHAAAWGR